MNAETMCELPRQVAAQGLAGPVTMVLDTARYRRNPMVMALAAELRIELQLPPSYSPNLNPIERLWRSTRRRACHGKFHADVASFRAAVESVLGGVETTHAEALESLVTLTFQEFEEVSLLAA